MKRPLAALLFATSVFAADKPFAIRAARLIDGRGGSVVAPAVIVVRGNHIESIGGAVPSDAQTGDLGGLTHLPGLDGRHTHALLHGCITSAPYNTQLVLEARPS